MSLDDILNDYSDDLANGPTPSEEVLARAARTAHHLFGTSIVLIGNALSSSLYGLDEAHIEAMWALAAAVDAPHLEANKVNVVLDAQKDERTAHLDAVRHLGLRFYADTALVGGQRFCIGHTEPLEHFGEAARTALLDVAALSVERLSLQHAATALKRSREFNQKILSSLPDCVKVLSLEGTLLYMSPNGQAALEVDDIEAFLGKSWLELWHGADTPDAREALDVARAGGTGHFQESLATLTDKSRFWDVRVTPILDAQGEPEKLLLVSRDITQQKQREHELESVREQLELANMKLEHDALHDMLTSLPNRKLFTEYVWTAISRLERHPDGGYAVLFLDFDDFKKVNDTHGHGVGDELLVAIAERLKHALRPSDIVARLAGDEFTVLLNDVQGEHDAVQAAERMIQAFAGALELSDQTLRVTVSIGVVMGETHYRRPEAILRDADAAMYRAKADGKAQYVVFRPALSG